MDTMKVTLHEHTFPDAPAPREAIYRQGNPNAGNVHTTYRISVAEGREDRHDTMLHFTQAKPDHVNFGITNENLIAVVIDRLECLQKGSFPCEENDVALDGLRKGLQALKDRGKRRYLNNTAGKHEEVPYTPIAPVTVEVPAISSDAESSSAETSGEGDKEPEKEENKDSSLPEADAKPSSPAADTGSHPVAETPRRRGTPTK